MAHPHLPPPFLHLVGHFSLTVTACHYMCWWDNQTCRSLPILPTALVKCPQDFLQTLAQCSLQQVLSVITLKSALMIRMSILPSCSISFYFHTFPSPAYSLFYKWTAMSWDTGYLLGLWLYISWSGVFDATLVSQIQKYIFILKLLLSMNISSLSWQFLAKLSLRPSKSY